MGGLDSWMASYYEYGGWMGYLDEIEYIESR